MASPSAEFVASLVHTLEQLASAGDERKAAEDYLSSTLLSQSPSHVLLGLVTIGVTNADEALRTLAFVLLRRLAFRPIAGQDPSNPLTRDVWDLVEESTRTSVQNALLQCLSQSAQRRERERGVICDVIAEVERAGLARAITWPALSSTLSQLYASPALALREATFRIYSECPSLLEAEPTPSIIQGLSAGLRDSSTGVKLAALTAAVSLLKGTEPQGMDQYSPLIPIMLDVLPPLAAERAEARLTQALLSLIDLASTPKVPSRLFKTHLASILSFCLSIMSPSPYAFSPSYSAESFDDTVRQPALELLLSIAETAPSMTKSFADFPHKLIPVLLAIMAERDQDMDWLRSEDFDDDDDDSMAVVAEGALDRISQALGEVVFPPFVQQMNTLLVSEYWQHRHAALSAIASIAEGCVDQIIEQLEFIMPLILQAMKDTHPRVRYAAVYAAGQLCTDLDGAIQDEHGQELLTALMGVTNEREPRLQAYAAAACVNFLQTADAGPLQPILPAVFAQLVRLLENGTSFVKQNAIEAMTLLAGCMEEDFTPLYPSIMPRLITLLETGTHPSLQSLRAKALDCASTIAAAVNSSVFAPDANRLLSALHNLQSTIAEDDDETERYLLGAYAQLAEVVGPEAFAPYVEDVFPRLIEEAQKKPDMTIGGGEEEDDDDEWETIEMNGDVVAIRTTALEEKAEAVQNLVILVQAIGEALPVETLQGVLQVAVPLLKFYFHVGVREGAAALIAVSILGLSKHDIPLEQRQSILNAVSDAFTEVIASETDSTILAVLIASWSSSYFSLPGCLAPAHRDRFIKAIEAQLTTLSRRERERMAEGEVDEDDVQELTEAVEEDAQVFSAMQNALRNLLRAEGAAFPIQPILPFLDLMSGTSEAPTYFALKLFSDIIQSTGEASPALVGPYLDRVLVALTDVDPATRRIAAYAVGNAAETAPAAFADFAVAAIEPLFSSIGPIHMDDNAMLSARDNAISALSKIIRSLGDSDKLDTNGLLSRWVLSLPVLVDGEEMTPTNTLLMELIARGHPSVSPTSDVAHHVLKCLVAALQAEDLSPSLQRPIAQTLKTYVSSMPGGASIDIPADVQAKVVGLLEG